MMQHGKNGTPKQSPVSAAISFVTAQPIMDNIMYFVTIKI